MGALTTGKTGTAATDQPPGPHVIATAGEMLAFAGTWGPVGLRSGIVREAGVLLEKSFRAAEEPAQVTSIAS